MFELSVPNALGAALLGVPAVLSWMLLLIVLWGVSLVVWWIDDYESTCPRNPLINWFMTRNGFEYKQDGFREKDYYVKEGHDTWSTGDVVGVSTLPMVIAPSIVYWCVAIPPIPITITVLIFIVFLARSGRRMQKLLKKHMVDPQAHQAESE